MRLVNKLIALVGNAAQPTPTQAREIAERELTTVEKDPTLAELRNFYADLTVEFGSDVSLLKAALGPQAVEDLMLISFDGTAWPSEQNGADIHQVLVGHHLYPRKLLYKSHNPAELENPLYQRLSDPREEAKYLKPLVEDIYLLTSRPLELLAEETANTPAQLNTEIIRMIIPQIKARVKRFYEIIFNLHQLSPAGNTLGPQDNYLHDKLVILDKLDGAVNSPALYQGEDLGITAEDINRTDNIS